MKTFSATFVVLTFSLLGFGVYAEPATTPKVAEYLEKGFGMKYDQVEDGMLCMEGVSTPKNKVASDDKSLYVINCQAKSSTPVNIGWKKKSFDRFKFQSLFAVMVAKDNNIAFEVTDRVRCARDNPVNFKEILAACSITFTSGQTRIPFNFYVLYQNNDPENDVFVLVHDSFGNQKEKTREVILEYQSRIK